MYSLRDIDVLAYVQYLTCVKKVNVAGVLEIQRLLKLLDSQSHADFMKEIEKEIELLPQDQKKAFTAPTDNVAQEIIEAAENMYPK